MVVGFDIVIGYRTLNIEKSECVLVPFFLLVRARTPALHDKAEVSHACHDRTVVLRWPLPLALLNEPTISHLVQLFSQLHPCFDRFPHF